MFREASTNQIEYVLLSCRGVNMSAHGPDANTRLAQALLNQLRAQADWFDTNDTKLVGELGVLDAESLTFSFAVSVRLNRPISH